MPRANRFSGLQIVRWRNRAGMTQSELARRVGVQEAMLSRWERGKHVPGANAVAALAHALGCDVGDLFTADESAGEDEEDGDPLRGIASELVRRGHDDLARTLLDQIRRLERV